ncbi:hypothetical protein CFC21_101025 [Triticum aestivum]|uniref:Uncharacterized protein n=4 Tax=Triticum TaxID=4564 RepID=A0A9R1BVE4_TRITD|nr:hypothetical protein CFC21_101025 [Triticum aestivum]VAI82484.1 unnamed protein product [Triticum turgidum subsp. durum]
MGTRSEELAARLAAGGPGGVGGPAGGGCGEGQHERVVALREIKNQTFGNQTKKLLYLRLGAVLAVVTARHQPCSSMSGRGGVLCLRRRRWRACRACCWSRGAPPRPPRQPVPSFFRDAAACQDSQWHRRSQRGHKLTRIVAASEDMGAAIASEYVSARRHHRFRGCESHLSLRECAYHLQCVQQVFL